MPVVIFAGPTIHADDVTRLLPGATSLPPAAQGDVYRAALARPAAIGLIDGLFERVPAVWHKEILWALSQGIHVFGSASMGALRAAELTPFGMVGVGAIFEAYRDGVLEDDDEVAVAHGQAESGYRVGSDAMVNIRATLVRAVHAGIVDYDAATALEHEAKRLFYPERSYAHLLEIAGNAGLDAGTVDRLRGWLAANAVNQKRDDAVAMLEVMRRCLDEERPPARVSFVFEETLWWQQLTASSAETGLTPADSRVLDGLSRDRTAWERAVAGALGWQLARRVAEREGWASDAATLVDEAAALCRRHGLQDEAAVERWLSANRYTRWELEHLLDGSAVVARTVELAGDTLTPVLLQYLRWSGDYSRLLSGAGLGTGD